MFSLLKLREAVPHLGKMVDRIEGAQLEAGPFGVLVNGALLVPWPCIRWCEVTKGQASEPKPPAKKK